MPYPPLSWNMTTFGLQNLKTLGVHGRSKFKKKEKKKNWLAKSQDYWCARQVKIFPNATDVVLRDEKLPPPPHQYRSNTPAVDETSGGAYLSMYRPFPVQNFAICSRQCSIPIPVRLQIRRP